MTHSQAAQHAQSLALLQDVADYLKRLPIVPTTSELRRRIDQHLHAPENAAIARSHATAGLEFRAGAYTAAGFPLIEAHVVVPTSVRLTSKIHSEDNHQAEHERALLELICGDGLHLALSPAL